MLHLQTTKAILIKSEELSLYKKLVIQLNKDFLRANILEVFREDILPNDLIIQLQETVSKLMNEQFSEYLNLLYIVDVSEEKIKEYSVDNSLNSYKQVVFLILSREWQKVWFRSNY